MNSEKKVILSSKLGEALSLAVQAHSGQFRKSTNIPYVSHPMAVASIALEFGADEEQAIAALLHDVLEDGGKSYEDVILNKFGPRVLHLVRGCTAGTPDSTEQKKPWKDRKNSYLKHLESAPIDVLIVSGADKLHNARAIVQDLQKIGITVFDRFMASTQQILWYYDSLAEIFSNRETPMAKPLALSVQQMRQLSKTGAVAEILRHGVDSFFKMLIELLGPGEMDLEINNLTREQEQELMLLVISLLRITAEKSYSTHPFIHEFQKFGAKNFENITMYLGTRTQEELNNIIKNRMLDYMIIVGDSNIDGSWNIHSVLNKFAILANSDPDLLNRVTSIGAQKFILKKIEEFIKLLNMIEVLAGELEKDALIWLGERMRAPDGNKRGYGSFGDSEIRISPRMQRWNPGGVYAPLRWTVERLERDFERDFHGT
jgi:hypothetical protein